MKRPVTVPFRTLSRVPFRALARVPLRTLSRVPFRALARMPLRTLSRVPFRALVNAPFRTLRRAPFRALASFLLCILSLTACGVQPTGVIPAGPAPVGYRQGSPRTQITLYFVLAGQVSPVRRQWAAESSPTTALTELFGGPTLTEQQEGFYSALPRGRPVSVDTRSTQAVVTVQASLKEVYPDGLKQVVCTTAAALAASGRTSSEGITVITLDTKLDSLFCN